MTTESIDIILTATDNATAVIKKSTVEMELLNDHVNQVSKSSAASSDALQKFANVVGAGWIADGASQAKELAEATKGMSASLKGGGAAALSMKAGLVGLVAYGSFQVGKMISDWVWQTEAARKEMEKLQEVFSKQSDSAVAAEQRKNELAKRNFELLQTTSEKEQAAKEKELALTKEIQTYQGRLDQVRGTGNENYERVTKQIMADKEKELAFFKNFNSDEEKAYRQKVHQIEQQKTRQEEEYKAYVEQEKQKQKVLEDRVKFEQEQIEKTAKLQEKVRKKQLDDEIKAAAEEVKVVEKEISDLESMKLDVSRPALSSKDERMTSLARGSGDIQQQQLEQSKRQVKLAELNQKLMQENSRYLKLLAEKEETVISIGGG